MNGKGMGEGGKKKTQVPSGEVNFALETPFGQPDGSDGLERLAKVGTKGPYISRGSFQDIFSLGFIQPKLPKHHGPKLEGRVFQFF